MNLFFYTASRKMAPNMNCYNSTKTFQFCLKFSGASEHREQGQWLLPNFLGGEAVLSRKFVDVTDSRWWLFTGGSHQHSFVSVCTKLTKLVDFYDVTGDVLVSLLLS